MSRYLARLKALLAEKPLPEKLTKLTEGASVSSVSDQSSHFCATKPAPRNAPALRLLASRTFSSTPGRD